MNKFCLLGLLTLAIITLDACTTDALPEPLVQPCDVSPPTYEANVREIVERTCAYSGCHLGGAPGLYNSYEGLLSDLESGEFRQEVIISKNMPPPYAPEGRAKELTEEEFMMVTCWLEAGYPE